MILMKAFKNFEDSKMFKGVPIKKQQENPFHHFKPTEHSKSFLLGLGVGLMAPVVATGFAIKHFKKKK